VIEIALYRSHFGEKKWKVVTKHVGRVANGYSYMRYMHDEVEVEVDQLTLRIGWFIISISSQISHREIDA